MKLSVSILMAYIKKAVFFNVLSTFWTRGHNSLPRSFILLTRSDNFHSPLHPLDKHVRFFETGQAE
jgi:hypothetical protein